MTEQLRGSRILLTGATSGIGESLAGRLAAEGARLVVTARRGELLAEVASRLAGQHGTDVVAVPADITRPEHRESLVRRAADEFGGLDILINNAGITSWAHFVDSDEATLRRIMEVNFFAPAELIRLAIPLLEQGKHPAIVNVASMCGRRGMPAWPEYSASKFALCGLTEALRGEMVRFGIDVLLIVPGLTRTGLHDAMLRREGKAEIDFSRGMPPDYVADRILDAIKRRRIETVIGRDARWMLRVNRFTPWLVDRLLARKVRKLYSTPEGGVH